MATTLNTNINTTDSSPPSWRCTDHRLHRGDKECTDSPPSSPIIDTPGKRLAYEKKMARLSQNQSSPSAGLPKPQKSGKTTAVPQGRGRARVLQSIEADAEITPAVLDEELETALPSPPHGESQVQSLAPIAAAVSAGIQKGKQIWRETTPFDHQVTDNEFAALPRSPVVRPSPPPNDLMSPLALTAQQDDLDVFNPEDDLPQPAFRKVPAPANNERGTARPQTSSHAMATSDELLRLRNRVRRMSHTLETQTARAARLETRKHVHEAMRSHHVQHIALVERDRRQAEFEAERERGGRLFWMTVCFFLVLLVAAYVWWCYYNGADFEYIRERRAEMFG